MKWNLVFFDKVESTNDAAASLPFKTCVVAKEQTKARGRMGRKWISLTGNLFFSLVLKNYGMQTPLLSFVLSLSVAECLKEFNATIKWPNDVLIDSKKASGILLENLGDKVIAGVGINTQQAPFEDVLYPTTSLDGKIKNDVLLKNILNSLDENIHLFETEGFQKIKDKWLTYSKGVGQEIIIRLPNEEIKGEFIGLTDEGAVQIKTKDLNCRFITAGDVFFLDERKKND